MPRKNVLDELSIMEELRVMRALPTLKDVCRGFQWRQNELKTGKRPHYRPPIKHVARLVEEDIKKTWRFANFGENMLSSRRIIEMITTSHIRIYKLKIQSKQRLMSPAFRRKLMLLQVDSSKLFDIAVCKCKFDFNETVLEHNIPCINRWRTKVVCSCPIGKRLDPRELKFLLDQRGCRQLRIGGVDRAATAENQRRYANRRASNALTDKEMANTGLRIAEEFLVSESENDVVGDEDNDTSFKGEAYDQGESLVSPNVCKLTDRKNVSIRSTADILNDAAESLHSPASKRSHMAVYRKKCKLRQESLQLGEEKIRDKKLQCAIDGKKLFNRERFAGLLVCRSGTYFSTFRTFRVKESCNAPACCEIIIGSLPQIHNLLSVIADTTSLNTGQKGGIFRRLEIYFKRTLGQDILVLECLFHINELLLGKVIGHYDGDTTSPNSLDENAVFNSIRNIDKSDLTPQKLILHANCDIKPKEKARQFLSDLLDWLVEQPVHDEQHIRDDQASMLVLACSTFRSIPKPHSKGPHKSCNFNKYLYYKQETISHARWLTTANGYLRLKLFKPVVFEKQQQVSLNNIVQFILDVYAPSFCNIFLHPSAVQGPKIVVTIRDLMKASGEVALPAKKCFIDHAQKWVCPKTVALCLLEEEAPIIDLKRLAAREPNTTQLLWSNRPISAFFNATSATSPCLTAGEPEDWRSFRNNNMVCERLIGQTKKCITDKKIKDSSDDQSDEQIRVTDERIRGYINHAFY